MKARSAPVRILRETVEEFLRDECPRLAAALSFYTVLALPPLLVLLLMLAGSVLDPEEVRDLIRTYLSGFIGPGGMAQIEAILRNAQAPGSGSPARTGLGIAGLLFGATGAFAQLQDALNKAWEIEPDPARGSVRSFLAKRLTSFLLILGTGTLLLSSVVMSAVLSAFGDLIDSLLPSGWSADVLQALTFGVSLVVVAFLFGALFKVLPDAVIRWRDVAVGAGATALAFVGGKTLFGIYLGRSDPGSAYGAAGSLAVLLLWIYFSALVLLLGAEFTQVWARHHGARIVPEPGAICARGERDPAPPRPGWRERVRAGRRDR